MHTVKDWRFESALSRKSFSYETVFHRFREPGVFRACSSRPRDVGIQIVDVPVCARLFLDFDIVLPCGGQ